MDYSPPGFSVYGILQARILQWVAMPSPKKSSLPRDRTQVSCTSCIAGRFFTADLLGKTISVSRSSQPWLRSLNTTDAQATSRLTSKESQKAGFGSQKNGMDTARHGCSRMSVFQWGEAGGEERRYETRRKRKRTEEGSDQQHLRVGEGGI